MFRAHKPILRRVHTAVYTTIGSVSVLLWPCALYVHNVQSTRPEQYRYWTNGCVNSCVNSPEDGPVGPKHIEIRQYINTIEIVTSVGFYSIWGKICCPCRCRTLPLSVLDRHLRTKLLTVFWLFALVMEVKWYDIFNCNWVATRWQLLSTHIHTNNTGNVTKRTIHRTTQKYLEQHQTIHRTTQKLGRVRAVPRLCGFYPGICLTTEEKARKNLSQGSHT